MTRLVIKKAAVLGAGVMGAQIAAHLVNANIPVVLFDIPSKEADKNRTVRNAVNGLKKLQPLPFASADKVQYIDIANYDDDLALLSECDLVIEAIAERIDWKNELYERLSPYFSPTAIIATNTSGISIAALASGLPEAIQPRFCGVHFFNPPRYMALVEIIPIPVSDKAMLDALESWLTTHLGKSVIRALDTPNFIANRIGVFSLLAVMHHTAAFDLGFDEVDALTGPRIGRPKSATYRTVDVVGLDTLSHAISTMRDTLLYDDWRQYFETPTWFSDLIGKGALGQKTKEGFFKKVGKGIHVLDRVSQDYRAASDVVADEVAEILRVKDQVKKFEMLRHCSHPQAQFLWAIFRDVFHYCAVQLEHIADNARDLDFAIRWGYGWEQGPFETWQSAGWKSVADAISEDIAAGKTMSGAPLPGWVFDGREGVHTNMGSWSASRSEYAPRSNLSYGQRNLFPERVSGEGGQSPENAGVTLFEDDGVRLWCLPEVDDGIGIVSFKSKMHVVGGEVMDGLLAAIEFAERRLDGLVVWHKAPFGVGANLAQFGVACAAGQFNELEATVEKFQRCALALKYAQVPTVAGVEGMALGGGCELAMHATKRVLALESYLGLVEAGVGLIPAGGGCKEFALRAAELAKNTSNPDDVFPFLQNIFSAISSGKISTSAHNAIEYGFAKPSDTVLFNAGELLYVAIKSARALSDAGYSPPLKSRAIPVCGRAGIANFEAALLNLKEGKMISEHDYRVSRAAAVALCGGEVDAGSLVDETWLLAVERQQFVALLRTPETQARIAHLLESGKPLRN